jgi:hypothetical protein
VQATAPFGTFEFAQSSTFLKWHQEARLARMEEMKAGFETIVFMPDFLSKFAGAPKASGVHIAPRADVETIPEIKACVDAVLLRMIVWHDGAVLNAPEYAYNGLRLTAVLKEGLPGTGMGRYALVLATAAEMTHKVYNPLHVRETRLAEYHRQCHMVDSAVRSKGIIVLIARSGVSGEYIKDRMNADGKC